MLAIAALWLLVLPVLTSLIVVIPSNKADAAPPLDGDWLVTASETLSDQEVILNGNLTVVSGGSLVLDNVTLKMNCSFNGEFNITIRNGAGLVMRNSTVTPGHFLQANRYNFLLKAGSSVDMYDSTIEAVGTGNMTMPSTQGLYVETSDARIVNNTFTRINPSYFAAGIVIGPLASPLIQDNEISGIYVMGIYQLIGSKSVIKGNRISANGIGISSFGAFPTLISNEVYSNLIGMQFVSASPTLENNSFSSNFAAGLGADFSTISLAGDEFEDNRIDMMVNTSGLSAHDITTSGSIEGIRIDNCTGKTVRFSNSSFAASGDTVLSINISDVWLVDADFPEDAITLLSDEAHLHVAWYLDVHTVFTSGGDTSDADISVMDIGNGTVFQGKTDASGWSRGIEVEGYRMQGQTRTELTPHKVKASKGTFKGNATVDMDMSKELEVELDDVGPKVNISEPAEGTLTNSSVVEFKGSVSDRSPLAIVEYRVDGGSWEAANGLETWDFHLTLTDGSHQVTVKATDVADNDGSAMVNISIDTVTPPLTILTPKNDSLVNDSRMTVTGKTERGVGLTYTLGDQTQEITDIGPVGGFDFQVNLSEGRNMIEVTARDDAGNQRTVGLTVTLDTIPPKLVITEPEEDVLTNSSQVSIKGATDGNGSSMVTINGLPMDIHQDGSFGQAFQLSDGSYSFKIVARDHAGNSVMTIRKVTVDTTPPGLEIILPTGDVLTNNRYLSVIGRAETTNVTIGALKAEPFTGTDPGWWDFDELFPLVEGVNRIIVTAIDEAGNSVSKELTATLDTVPPALTITAPSEGTRTKEPHITVSGTTEVGATISINGSFVPVSNGTFSISYPLALGENLLRVTSTDPAGNMATDSIKVTREKGEDTITSELSAGLLGLLLLVILIMVVAVFLLTYKIAMMKTSKKEDKEEEDTDADEWDDLEDTEEDMEESETPGTAPHERERGSLVLGADHDMEFAPRPRDEYIITRAYDLYGEPERTKYTDTLKDDTLKEGTGEDTKEGKTGTKRKKGKGRTKKKGKKRKRPSGE